MASGINIRAKGQNGEREIAQMLNDIYAIVYAKLGLELPEKDIAQRRQNQSAVGGSDLDNTCGFSIEIKRQEQLAINTWWTQCLVSAKEDKKMPVLLYRQSRKQWKAVLFMHNTRMFDAEPQGYYRCEMSIDDFKEVFTNHAYEYIRHTGSAK